MLLSRRCTRYFPGKEELYAAVAAHGREELASILEQSFGTGDFRSGIEILFDTLTRYTSQFNGIYSEMMLLAGHNEQIRTLLRQDRIEDINIVESFIRRQQDGGVIPRKIDPRALAIAGDALLNGLLIDILAGLDKKEAKKIWIRTVMQLIRTDDTTKN